MKEMTDLIKTTQTNENKSEFHLKDFDLVTFNLIIKKFDKYEIFKKRKRKTSTLEVDLIDTTTKNLAQREEQIDKNSTLDGAATHFMLRKISGTKGENTDNVVISTILNT